MGGDTYLSGLGAKSYMDDKLFERSEISLEYNYFCHPSYRQCGSKQQVNGLSIVDMIMNIGYNNTSDLLSSYRSR